MLKKEFEKAFSLLKNNSPLVHHITNYVTAHICADITLAIGASPVMADAIEEVEEMVGMSSSLVINIGTLNERTVKSMIKAGQKANKCGVPVILDPVGAGATTFRYETTKKLIEKIDFTIIKGNLSEIKTIGGLSTKSRGVDSIDMDSNSHNIGKELAKKLNCVIAITGQEDIISDGETTLVLKNGTSLLGSITGTGCMSASLIGSFLGTGISPLASASLAILTMCISAEMAAKRLSKDCGSKSFKTYLIDGIYNMDYDSISKEMNVEYV
ncbi:MAG: hydroxyethylthiazole kinase [Anaeromicrobium sp.]|jgi:hydroxyethylthiazole kinase|uniref:hydroxyethylthiazole kinase n=1 Tax=Anaeromicrobium sp. TaxID=1929132 RepID=UPI0025EEEF96|nr:hydroxyethylthiazole kinase [Anaeromicrobium sp.]MCT4595954.1 hydroxyethylthiazole kinase [Anaeromicrobium sp.]